MAKILIAETTKLRDHFVQSQQQQPQLQEIPRALDAPKPDENEQDVQMRDCEDNFIKFDGIMIR